MTTPFSVNVVNYLPTQTFGTTPAAGLVPGLVGGLVMLVVGLVFLTTYAKRQTQQGIGWEDVEGDDEMGEDEPVTAWGLIRALIPIAVVFGTYNFLSFPIAMSTLSGSLVMILLNFNKFPIKKWLGIFCDGATKGVAPTLDMAAIAGYAAVVTATPFYSWFIDYLGTVDMNPYLLAILVATILAGLLASGTNAVVISLASVGNLFMRYGSMGYDLGNIIASSPCPAVSWTLCPPTAPSTPCCGCGSSPIKRPISPSLSVPV